MASEADQKAALGNIAESPVGVRYDGTKLRFDLIPTEWDRALAHVLTKGAAKYAPRNWEKGMDWSRMIGALRRHLDAWLNGETWDADTGAHHLSQVAWNALVLMSYQLRGVGKDDLQRSKIDYPQV